MHVNLVKEILQKIRITPLADGMLEVLIEIPPLGKERDGVISPFAKVVREIIQTEKGPVFEGQFLKIGKNSIVLPRGRYALLVTTAEILVSRARYQKGNIAYIFEISTDTGAEIVGKYNYNTQFSAIVRCISDILTPGEVISLAEFLKEVKT